MAHIGVIKALEENGVPIDYITGTSAGALIGALYACGYSPEEIEGFILSNEFLIMANGNIPEKNLFLFRDIDRNASVINFSISKDSVIRKSIPLNLITPTFLDFEMLTKMGQVSASNGKDFDRLFVPFRCVASDVAKKRSVVFKNGDLNKAVRASMTYPFYLNPIKIDGVLYYDGGLYNNFPADIMYNDFNPDMNIINRWKEQYENIKLYIISSLAKTVSLDDKIAFCKRMSKSKYLPECFYSYNEIPISTNNDEVFFVKSRGSTNAAGVNVYLYKDLLNINM